MPEKVAAGGQFVGIRRYGDECTHNAFENLAAFLLHTADEG